MKTKIFLSLVAALFISQAMMAQFHIGVKAGANVHKIEGKSFKDEFRYGYHLGGFAEIGFGGKLGIQPEVIFNQYSTTLDSNYKELYENVFNSGQNIRLNYLSIPVLLNYKLLGNLLTLQAGPQFGILLDNSKTLLQNGGNAFKDGDLSFVGVEPSHRPPPSRPEPGITGTRNGQLLSARSYCPPFCWSGPITLPAPAPPSVRNQPLGQLVYGASEV